MAPRDRHRRLGDQPAALIHAKQRASQNDHPAIADAADDLLQRLDDTPT